MNWKTLLAACCFVLCGSQVFAQGASPELLPGGCGTASYTYGTAYFTVDSTGKECVNASVSASITGFPTIQSTGTPISVTTGGVTGTLPSGTVVVASNVGSTNGAYCKLGASATTSDQLIPPNSWFAFTVGANTQLTCITSTSTTTVNMVGGSGLPTGSGGGGGGSGGGAVTVSNGADTAEGSTTDTPASTPTNGTAASVVALLKALANAVTSAIPAGTNLIGNTGQVYPAGSTPITISATGTVSATTATLAANASLHTYICGFSIRANATGAATNNATVTGTVTGTLNFTQWTAPLASGLGVTEEVFSPCIISSAVNTGIAVVSGAPGSGGVVSVTAWGYQL